MNGNRREFLKRSGGGMLATSVFSGLTIGANAAGAKRPPIKIGQIGTGHAHASKLMVYRNSADYEIVGVVEPNEQLRAKAESQEAFRGLPWLTQEQLLNVPGVEAVLIETEVRDLLNVAQTCVTAGKHIHLDKPAGQSLPQFGRILDAAAQQKLLVQMGYMYRYNPGVQLLHDLLKRGWLGELFEVHAVMSKVVDSDGRRRLASYPGGMMFELGCHLIDLVVGLLGAPAKVTPFAQRVGRGEDQLIDNMLAVFEYPRALATVKSSAVEVEGFSRRHLVACGSEGTVHIEPLDDPSARVALSKSHDPYRQGYQRVSLPKYTRYVADAADMARIIRGEKEPAFSYEHDLAVQTALMRACGLPTDT